MSIGMDLFMSSLEWDGSDYSLYLYQRYARTMWSAPDWYDVHVYQIFYGVRRPIIRDIEDGAEVDFENITYCLYVRDPNRFYIALHGYEGTLEDFERLHQEVEILAEDRVLIEAVE
ncbi:hypothetical protein M6B38_159025 [Iris pallida]|uniref:Uncharacterized protein n=1 Tax=Iris pallida TaxID=29817 RepID=A0AAX6F2F1_IRIPA|nr:hypothetical protein M6B38_159025 [Iris pallida]